MKKEDIKAPFPREPWKRLLEDSSDAPPETTDARIRASARKAVTPHAARWWVHAGLAASFVVAVVIAQALFGGGGRDPAGESRVDVDLLNRPNAISPPPPPEAAAAPVRKEAARAAGQAPAIETDDDDESAAGELAEIEVDDSRIGGPERERRAASETPEESFVTDPSARRVQGTLECGRDRIASGRRSRRTRGFARHQGTSLPWRPGNERPRTGMPGSLRSGRPAATRKPTRSSSASRLPGPTG